MDIPFIIQLAVSVIILVYAHIIYRDLKEFADAYHKDMVLKYREAELLNEDRELKQK